MLQKTGLAILGFTVSHLVSAGEMASANSCTPTFITTPCEDSKWNFGAQALYFQPTYSADKPFEEGPDRLSRTVRAGWGWAYRLEGSYHYQTGNDVAMTFIYFDNDTHRRGFAGEIPALLAFEPFNLKLENKLDQVNLTLGQHVDISTWKKIRFYGGLQYARIRVDEKNHYLSVPPLVARRVNSIEQYRNADFNGVGPVIGFDYFYNLIRGFSVTANSATSILYGSERYAQGFVLGPAGLVMPNNNHSQKTIVPSIEAKLGLQYAAEYGTGTLNLEAGFQAINYFNALETRRPSALGAVRIDTSNFGLYGSYFGAKWLGDV